MKSFMFVAFGLVLVLGLTNSVQAQGYVSGAVPFTAVVTAGLVLDVGLSEGEWLDLTQGQCYTFSTDGVKNPDPFIGGMTPPGFGLDGNPYDYVEVSLMLPVQLFGADGGRLIPTNWKYGYNDQDDFTAPFLGVGSADAPFAIQLNAGGHASVYLGATLCVSQGQYAGDYAGQIGISAHYMIQP